MNVFYKIYFISLILFSSLILGHQRSESHSSWIINHLEDKTEVSIALSIKLSVLSRMDWKQQGWENQVLRHVVESINISPNCFVTKKPMVLAVTNGSALKIIWEQECASGILQIENGAFFDKDPFHAHIARFEVDKKPLPEKLFTNDSRVWEEHESFFNDEGKIEVTSLKDYVFLGLEHIITGFDHIAFLLGLLLLNQQIKSLLIAITGFTIGHSFTLFLGVVGFIKPSTGFVEALIGYSIALVSLEFLAKRTGKYFFYSKVLSLFWAFFLLFVFLSGFSAYLTCLIGLGLFTVSYFYLLGKGNVRNLSIILTCLFGLVHGFGFGGYLSEIGLPEDRLLPALFGFNIGVELGQILLVIIFFLLIRLLTYVWSKNKFLIEPFIASTLISLGLYWFILRIF